MSLAGRSRTEETRAQVLERTRRERERRRQEKLEHKSATTIQARAWVAQCTCCLTASAPPQAFLPFPHAGRLEGLVRQAAPSG